MNPDTWHENEINHIMGKCLKLQISISEGKNFLSNTSDEQGEQGGNGKQVHSTGWYIMENATSKKT